MQQTTAVLLKKIFYFTHGNPSGACVRYRGKYLLRALEDHYNFKTYFVYPSYKLKHILNFFWILILMICTKPGNRILICQKIYRVRIYSKILLYIFKYTRSKTIYDIDDAYYVNHGDTIINRFMKYSNTIVVGSDRLKTYSHQFNKSVYHITSPVILQEKTIKEKPKEFTIGWVGSFNYHRKNLYELALPAIKEAMVPCKLIISGINRDEQRAELIDYFEAIQYVDLDIVDIQNWENEELVYSLIKRFTVGINPLRNNEIDNCKSAFKIKQYFACGVPALASPIGENNKFLEDYINGISCNSISDFKKGIIEFNEMTNEDYKRFQKNCFKTANTVGYEYYVNEYLKLLN